MRVGGILGGDLYLILNACQGAQLRLYHHAVVMRILNNLLCDLNILSKGLAGCVNHHRGKAAVNTALAQFKTVAMVQVQADGSPVSITAASTSFIRYVWLA